MARSIPGNMDELWGSSHLYGGSAPWLESLYEKYLTSPDLVEEKWRRYFDSLPKTKPTNGGVYRPEESLENIRSYFRELVQHGGSSRFSTGPTPDLAHEHKQVRVLQLINAYRFRGHQQARNNPLNKAGQAIIEELSLEHHGLTSDDFDTVFETGSLAGPPTLSLFEIYQILQDTYCKSIGAEYMHITETEEKRWIQEHIERSRASATLGHDEKLKILELLTRAEGLERYLHARYVGQKRFSLEGGESLIPLLSELISRSGDIGIKEVVIGMAHRGRLNVLINILGKTPDELFQEFEGTKQIEERTGDVKYHLGFSSDVSTEGGPVHLALAFNPSHLEIVAPVVEGSVRARQWRRGDREGNEVIPVQIHGDAAFSGQGVVMETLQMSQSRGFSTRGTIHIIVNNQIGFTTSFRNDARSTNYCTDVAKMVDATIFHVNGDDPEAVVYITRLAIEYRMAFKKDVVIDMICYRRHGHNEADEPTATQPMMYKKIHALDTTRSLYSSKLVNLGVITEEQSKEYVDNTRAMLEAGQCMVERKIDTSATKSDTLLNWKEYTCESVFDEKDTSVSIETIRRLSGIMEKIPEGFIIQPRVAKIIENRHKMCAGALPIDWGYAEILAYATLVEEGYSVRLTGQDSGRGTFFHRHAVLHNQVDGTSFVPLRSVGNERTNFLVIDSLLSELAVLAFEYGFSATEPETLCIWEAQFGDFANGAQVVIDQFISAGEHKWGRASGLVMLLPHGYEGQGAEHSSGRIERYLQLCSEQNMQVCVPSEPSQIFHLLRRQIVRKCRKPLIVMTPKSLLRHKQCISTLEDLTKSGFKKVIADKKEINPDKVKRVILCSGKIFYELLERRKAEKRKDIAIVRVEQLYPFPGKELSEALACYTTTKDLVWCQEEPKNQGAWDFCKPRLAAMLDQKWIVSYAGRESSSAPAVGSAKLHAIQQNMILDAAFTIE